MPETLRGGRDSMGAKQTPLWSSWSLKSSQGHKH